MYTDENGEVVNGIKRVRYSHDAMIDLLIAEPSISQNQLAATFDRSPSWISQVINSDAFQARLEERKTALVDPLIVASIKERLSAVADVSLGRLLDRLSGPLPVTDDFLLKAADLSTKALGYGARVPTGSTTNVAVVVQVPPKLSGQEWAATYTKPAEVVQCQPLG